MGNYNPRVPIILGQEWAPIRDEDLVFSPSVNSVERGSTFVLNASTAIADGRFYAHELPPDGQAFYQCVQLGLYPTGTEAETGPIQQVIIPVSNVTITGATVVVVGANATDALYQPGDNKYLFFPKPAGTPNANAGTISCYFKANDYPILSGKRILNVSMLYRGSVQDGNGVSGGPFDFVNPLSAAVTIASQYNDAGVGQGFATPGANSATGVLTLNTKVGPANLSLQDAVTNVLNMGDVNNCWDSTNPAGTDEKLPWLYSDLQRFEFGGANRQHMEIRFNLPETAIGTTSALGLLDYVALRVLFCEETRIAYGAQQFKYSYGMNKITLHNLARATTPTIPSDEYTVTLSAVSLGQVGQGFGVTGDFPKLNALRQAYEIPSHRGRQINVPFPPEDRLGSTFTVESVDVLPQISLHTTGAAVIEPHVYGRQADAQVYGTIGASQKILDSGTGAASYPQVRYIARRFGDTTVPLRLGGAVVTGLSVGTSGTASTPDNAVLDIVGDIELRGDAIIDDWLDTLGTLRTHVLVAKWPATGTGTPQSSYRLAITGGAIQFIWSITGTDFGGAVSISLAGLIPASGRLAVAASMDVNNGAGGKDIRFFTAPTIAGPWTQLGPTQTTAGVTSIFSGTTAVSAGSNADGSEKMGGILYAVQVLTGFSGGTQVANPNFYLQPPGTTSFNDAAGRTWTLTGTEVIVAGNSASSVTLTPAEWDALPELVDGWKEINRRFTIPPVIGAGTGNQQWAWTAAGETAGNRWEILGATAPAISGVPGSFVTQVPAAQRLTTGTYGAPAAGTPINMAWVQGYAPLVTTTTEDPSSDAVILLSQDPAVVTGVTVSTLSQSVTGFTECTRGPCCIPTAIQYNRITWNALASVLTVPGISGNTATTPDNAALDITGDIDIRFDGEPADGWATGASFRILVSKWGLNGIQDPNLSYRFGMYPTGLLQFAWSTTGSGGGINAFDSTAAVPIASGRLAVRVTVSVNNGAGGKTATFYTAPTIDGPWTQLGAAITSGGTTSFASTNSLLILGFDDDGSQEPFIGKIYAAQVRNGINGTIVANPNFTNKAPGTTSFTDSAGRVWTIGGSAAIVAALPFGVDTVELQRTDPITPWQTIMLASSPTVTGFSDYEARVGVTSSYRLRQVNVLDFAGPWSVTGTGTIAAPGVTMPSCGTNKRGVLIFTSNEVQSGLSNLAYAMTWEGAVSEDFSFPESDTIQIQRFHDRDFQVAFHGSERGGEQFSRTILIANAAVALPRLANMDSIRDLAWNDLAYVCVRDDIGDRWLSTVVVPQGTVRRNRRLYNADITVIEVTDTPTQVNP